MNLTVSFSTDIYSYDLPSSTGVKPIYDEDGTQLLGGFVLHRGDTIMGFLSGDDAYKLFFTSGAPWYLTIIEGPDGKVASARVSDVKLRPMSIKIETYKLGESNG